MTEKEYNEAEGVRRSDLWRMHESPEKYKWFLDHPEPPTPALIFGTAAHKMLLEPSDFFNEFIIAPNVDRRTKAGKEAYEAFLTKAEGKTVISQDDYDTVSEMAAKAMTVPCVRNLLNGKKEQAFFWTDEDTGELCKVRCDCVTEMDGKVAVVDYKTTTDARTNIFVNRDIDKYGYFLQAFMYTEAVMKNMGLTERPDFHFVVQEKKPPYSLNVVTVYGDSDVMMHGQDVFREYIGMLKQCKETGFWWGLMGPFNEPNEAYLPGYISLGNDEEE